MKNNFNQKIIVMPREMRLMTERIFNLTPLPIGFTRMLWDIVMYSEAIGLGGFKMLEDKLSLFVEANIHKIRILSVDKNKFVLDCGNQHAWLAIPSTLDLLVEGLGNDKITYKNSSLVIIKNVQYMEEFYIAESFANRLSIKINFDGKSLLAIKAKKSQDLIMDNLLKNGCMIDKELWWRIFDLAQKSLTEESSISLTHAGPIIIGENGQSIGRKDNDDDTDLNLIKDPKMLKNNEH